MTAAPVDAMIAALGQVLLFHNVDESALATLMREATPRHLKAGEWLFHEGDDADRLYVVLSGRLRIVVTRDGAPTAIRELGPGVALGELALLTGSVRSAGAQAMRDSQLLEIARPPFDRLLDSDPTFGHAIAIELARQLQASGGIELPRGQARVFSIMGASSSVSTARFGDALAAELDISGTVAKLTGEEHPDDWTTALARAEADASNVLLMGDAQRLDSEWNRFVRRHGDRLLLLADASATVVSEQGVTDLVLIGPMATGRTAQWLDAIGPGVHHIVGEESYEICVGRVARRVSGRSLGLVLSGGGARCLAHIGVIAAFAEADLTIDRFGGCSMGAFVAGTAALGLDADQIRAVCQAELVERSPFNDWTLPRVALTRTRKAERMLRHVFGERQVEELSRPLYTVSADLVSSQAVVHRRGPLFEAVGISMSIPGLVPPVARDGRLLVDGGVLNNLPVDPMYDLAEGPIVAVDVARRHERASGESPRIPSIMETMTRATILGSGERSERNRRLADLVISPEAQSIALRDFKALD
ncbi:patatin-like phospholipase family protein, partial [Gaiella sp.]|uniref:patatin-like phospholipase family protein n=1 Tax=Gaiella sp. TaxID=2663207 RepID=UPI003982E7BD